MKAIDILHCEIGLITSRGDHSCAFRVITPELRVSEAGQLMQWHGKTCRVLIAPHEGAPDETVAVDTERGIKSPSQRVRAVLFVAWKQDNDEGDFESYYRREMGRFEEQIKAKLL